MLRRCCRPGCPAEATATMSYDYRSRSAWLDDLLEDAEPHRYDLCHEHAERLRVPLGWSCTDRRVGERQLPFERIAV